jgi:hypothetical protein
MSCRGHRLRCTIGSVAHKLREGLWSPPFCRRPSVSALAMFGSRNKGTTERRFDGGAAMPCLPHRVTVVHSTIALRPGKGRKDLGFEAGRPVVVLIVRSGRYAVGSRLMVYVSRTETRPSGRNHCRPKPSSGFVIAERTWPSRKSVFGPNSVKNS